MEVEDFLFVIQILKSHYMRDPQIGYSHQKPENY